MNRTIPVVLSAILTGALGSVLLLAAGQSPPFEVRVEVEETVCHPPEYLVTNNGSGMFWDIGCTQIVRIGDKLFVSAFEAVPGCAPLNNARWALYERRADGWRLCQRDLKDRTREPSPLCVDDAGRLLMSVNPTLAPWLAAPLPAGKKGVGGPARPEFLEFDPAHPEQEPRHLLPQWNGEPKFTEHSYRTFAADAKNGEFILFQNIGATHTEWALLDKNGNWKTGQLVWPQCEDPKHAVYHDQRTRVNYPNVIFNNRAAHFIGNSPLNIWNRVDPSKPETWAMEKWGWHMRKLHYAWTPDVTTTPFTAWTVVDDAMSDGGNVGLGDSWIAPDGRVHVVWQKTPIDERLRDTYFPDIKRDWHLCYGILKDGKVLEKRVLFSGGETTGPLHPAGFYIGSSRFHITPDHTLYILFKMEGTTPETRAQSGTYAVRIGTDGSVSAPVRVPLERPITGAFFTATPRSGNALTEAADLLIADTIDGKSVARYARLRFGPACSPVVSIEGKRLVLPGEGREIVLKAVVSHPQKKETSVQWHLPDGTVREGASLKWTAPGAVGDKVTVAAVAADKDGNAGRASKTVSLPLPELSEAGLVRVEAESFVAQGGGAVRIFQTVSASGTSISYWHESIGHWLEWELAVPADGRYELWMRYATACTKTRRSLQIDGAVPDPAFADMAIPGTGGWCATEDNWRYMRLGVPIRLSAGKRRLRMTNLADGLAVDFFILRALR